jgi:hypothetical protein
MATHATHAIDKEYFILIINSYLPTQCNTDACEIVGIICDNGFTTNSIKVFDAARAREISDYVSETSHGGYPQLYSVNMNNLGGITECRSMHKDGTFKQMAEKARLAISKDLPLGVKDVCINGVEWMLRMVLLNPSGVTQEEKKHNEQKLAEAKTLLDVDFPVMRTNWYWRHQKRVIRLSPTEMKRIDPDTGIVKETLALCDITNVTLNATHVVLQFKNHVAEFFECVDAAEFVSVLMSRCGENKPVLVKQ